ncbi:MAG: chorismate-binding protein, partial [Desulfuromonadales bacterium]|nr:chorismate-binding protein [Desulfuromonadales bacterium]
MYFPSQDEFSRLATQGNLIPVYREILADMETPVSAFRKIDDGRTSFLLESIEGGEKWARYSFLGSGPGKLFRSRGTRFEIVVGETVLRAGDSLDPLAELKDFLAPYRPVQLPGLPRFFGGAVGYLGYDMVRFIERLPDANPRQIGAYDSCFLLTENLLIFDNMRQKIKAVCNVHLQAGEEPEAAWHRGVAQVEALIAQLRAPLPPRTIRPAAPEVALEPNFTPETFRAAVENCKEYVRAGDVIQVVLSQRFSGPLPADPFDIYRA